MLSCSPTFLISLFRSPTVTSFALVSHASKYVRTHSFGLEMAAKHETAWYRAMEKRERKERREKEKGEEGKEGEREGRRKEGRKA